MRGRQPTRRVVRRLIYAVLPPLPRIPDRKWMPGRYGPAALADDPRS
ncbi:MAG: hypothetical protein AVDCRST_MAG27-847 [uncultured Craurococcus sp.]|uniref:Uncharacterized protein n=1 Tax=uncultured Craurococcus sp. TaxID=1135998 RepID=A0A6J4HQ89_9PROT|nr:MAG: hypothetical protein AVDCRST_MAG27-847 [uncultured Craurococcus sp.]